MIIRLLDSTISVVVTFWETLTRNVFATNIVIATILIILFIIDRHL